ncbi:hypothetical protein ACE01U_03020 [Acinetobacter sp. BSP-153]|uniref:hypothetical protein n=1 Tax=unclassified Acinetobacter TaxID=196816 RepID=UPI000A348254|nr:MULTISPECIES: hypothetical protein [unclassified Acinetobacter]OTG59382.1 hypothetical protein B9T36_08435 [Acinetobacter sp. ANC 4204]RGD92527.1 hypothetical protein DYI96_04140 [Acinetobacter sp. SWAC57]
MKATFLHSVTLSIGLACMSQIGHSAAIQNNDKVAMPAEKTSLIEKALSQQKSGEKNTLTDTDLKIMTSIKVAPTQNFFATQNQRFSRFVQSLFL